MSIITNELTYSTVIVSYYRIHSKFVEGVYKSLVKVLITWLDIHWRYEFSVLDI
uniref:Uncharacterized protein n=1 Tax=Lepeophtheirus salmonis TaxID=72036 RepID=A0A0K2TCY2_LEPSM